MPVKGKSLATQAILVIFWHQEVLEFLLPRCSYQQIPIIRKTCASFFSHASLLGFPNWFLSSCILHWCWGCVPVGAHIPTPMI